MKYRRDFLVWLFIWSLTKVFVPLNPLQPVSSPTIPLSSYHHPLLQSMSFQEIPPFFEPGAPLHTRPTPLAQTEIGRMQVSDKLLAQEELDPNLIRRDRPKVRFGPYPSKSDKRNKKPLSVESDSDSSSLTDSDSEDDDDDDDDLIPKPEGEAGRPGRGGYNLEEALGWPSKEYRQLKVRLLYLVTL